MRQSNPDQAARLARARQYGLLCSCQHETAFRDRWSQECAADNSPIVHLIAGPNPGHGSVRINVQPAGLVLGPAGQQIAQCIATEHGGTIRQLDEHVIEALKMPPLGAYLLIQILNRSDVWFLASEVRR